MPVSILIEQHLSTGERRMLLFGACGVFVIVLATFTMFVLATQAVSSARSSNAPVQHTREVIETLQKVLSTFQDAETGERGYVITGKDKFLEPYERATEVLNTQLERLDRLLVDPRARSAASELAARAHRQIMFLQRVVELRRDGDLAGATELIRQELGKQQMDDIRACVASLEDIERAALAQRIAQFDSTSARSEAIIRYTLIASLVAVLIAGTLLLSYARRKLVAERSAKHTVEFMRSTVESITQGVVVFDPNSRVVAWNEHYLNLRGLERGKMYVGMPSLEMQLQATPMQLTVRGITHDSRTARPGFGDLSKPFDGEATYADGRVLQICGRPALWGHYIVTVSDITALKNSEAAHRDKAIRLSSILDNIADGVITFNESGSIESWSKGAERLFGYAEHEILRRNVSVLIPPSHDSNRNDDLHWDSGNRQVLLGRRDVEGLHKDGRTIDVELGVSEMRTDSRRLMVGVVRDVSERVEVEKMKSGFVSTVSHELRTPLTSISASLGLIAGGAAGEVGSKAARLIEIAKQNCERLVRLINDILDLEKAQSGKLEFVLQEHAIQPLVKEAIDVNRAFALTFGATIELRSTSADACVLVDRDRFIQVITNLLSNAAKFSPRGGTICVDVFHDNGRIAVAVEDEGPGVPAEFRKRIFGKFAQADSSDSRSKNGTGLGLSITKSMIERLGGSIEFDSQRTRGARFILHLPIHRSQREPIAAVPLNGLRVLVCEDDPDVSELIAAWLADRGAKITTAASIGAAKAALENNVIDLALVDYHLPDGKGIELIARLREDARTAGLPTIMMTAGSCEQAQLDEARLLNVLEIVHKPLRSQTLCDALANSLKPDTVASAECTEALNAAG